MRYAVNGCGSGHRIGEHAVPLYENRVGNDVQRAVFAPFVDEGEEDLQSGRAMESKANPASQNVPAGFAALAIAAAAPVP